MENYYRILSQDITDNNAEFRIELCEDCPVYAGHFPGNPIAPGACNIEMVRECISVVMKREVRLAEIKLCKFTRIIRPNADERLLLTLQWDNSKVKSTIYVGDELAAQINVEVL